MRRNIHVHLNASRERMHARIEIQLLWDLFKPEEGISDRFCDQYLSAKYRRVVSTHALLAVWTAITKRGMVETKDIAALCRSQICGLRTYYGRTGPIYTPSTWTTFYAKP